MSFERPPVSKFALQAQLLNRLVRASFDNVRGAREIAETSGQLERHSYNVSLVARRHRATALAFVPISQEIIRVTWGLQHLVSDFVAKNQEIVNLLVRYARALRLADLLGQAAVEVRRSDGDAALDDAEAALLCVRSPAALHELARGERLAGAAPGFRAAAGALHEVAGTLRTDADALAERYLVLGRMGAAIGAALDCGRYAADLGSMEARRLFGEQAELARTAGELCALFGAVQRLRQAIAARIDSVLQELPHLKE